MSTTATELIVDLRSELLEPSAAFYTSARMLQLINLGEKDFVQRTRCLEAQAYLSTLDGVIRYPMPSNFIGSEKVMFNKSTDSTNPDWSPLQSTSIEKITQQTPNAMVSTVSVDRGDPREYVIYNAAIHLIPCPDTDGDGNILMYYEAQPVPLTALSDNLNVDDTITPAIRAFVLWKCWLQDQEPTLADEQKALYFEAVGNTRRWMKRRQLDRRTRIDIVSPFGFSHTQTLARSNPLS